MPLILHSSNCSPHCCDTWRFPQLGLWRHVNWSLWWRQIDVSCTGRQPELHTHTCVDAWHTSDLLRTNMILNRLGLSRLCQLNNSLLHITCDRHMTKSICSHFPSLHVYSIFCTILWEFVLVCFLQNGPSYQWTFPVHFCFWPFPFMLVCKVSFHALW